MKHLNWTSAMLALAVLASCTPSPKEIRVTNYQYADSTAHADFSLFVDLPVAAKGAAGAIRDGVIELIDSQLGYINSFEGDRVIPAFSGDRADDAALIGYYRAKAVEAVEDSAAEDARERASYIEEDEDMTPEEKAEALSYAPRWEYDFSISKVSETPRYIVFLSEDFTYLGGAHGGVTGAGYVTFDKRDGSRFEDFLRDGCVEELQPLFRRELEDYLDDLFIEDGIIPLPVWAPYPTDEGLGFIYQQYEIAPYAMGMPGFVIPYDEIRPWLTPAARDLLKL